MSYFSELQIEQSEKIINKMQKALSTVNKKAADKIRAFIEDNAINVAIPQDMNRLIEMCYGVSTAYGEAAASVACEAYDALGLAADLILEPAVPAEVASYGEVAKALQGTAKTSQNANELSSSVSRLVKRTGQDTLLKNARRDGAEVAWIPSGDTCAFCIMLASRGWEHVSRQTARNGHAEHIHANCDCTYAIRFDSSVNYKGYDPDKYLEQYREADGGTTEEKLNSMRRRYYAENRETILAQKASAYEKRMELNSSAAEETKVD